MERRDGNAMAIADRDCFEWAPAIAGRKSAAALADFHVEPFEETHAAEKIFLPLLAELVGDQRRADVGAFLHDLGDRAGAVERMGIVDRLLVDVKLGGAAIHLPE